MKVLFISSGNKTGNSAPIIYNQGDSLVAAGWEVDYYPVIGKGIKGYLSNIPKLRKVVREGHYDMVHAHYAFNGYLASLAGIRPLVVSIMGSDIQAHSFYPALVRIFARLFRWGGVIVKSNEMYQRLGMARAKVVPNGVNMEVFRHLDQAECRKQLGWDSEKLHVLFPGNPSLARKNWPLASAAVERLKAKGEGLMGKEIELHPMVEVPNEKTPILYNACDAAILPSFYEGSANALKEAMACGCPIVCTPCGDAVERLKAKGEGRWVERVTGSYVAKIYEVEEVAGLLAQSLAFEGKTNGRQVLREDKLGAEQVAETIIEMYKKAKG